MNVVVVGAGLGGLSAACHLRAAGHDVLVLERASVPGGRCGVLELDGYRFDTGPTVLTMPQLIDDCFRAVGTSIDEQLRLEALDPIYRATFADGSVLRVWSDPTRMAAEIAEFAGRDAATQFARFRDWLRDLYALEMDRFVATNFDSPLDLAHPVGPLLRLVRHGGFGRLGKRVARYFDDERLQRVFSFQSLYAGLAPYEALAIYCVITYMDTVGGVCFPEGGLHAVPQALARAAAAAGVELRYGEDVERIVLADGASGRVRAVELATGERVAADAVVCNADLPVAYRTLLPGLPAPTRARKGRASPSCVVWHAGVRGRPAGDVAHHNIHFGDAWSSAFRALLRDGRCMPDPSILVSVPSVDDSSLAPDGCTTLYALEPVPNLDGKVDWSSARARVRDDLATRIAALGYPDTVEVEAFVDPTDWARQGMDRGTPFALAHTFLQTGPFRPGNVDRRAPGLVFVGSGTVPGVGVPMVLISGRLAAERVEQLRR